MSTTRIARNIACALLLVTCAYAWPASALTPEEEATATRLMREGIAARERGELAEAELAFGAAHAIADLPSSGIALAKVLAQRGQLLRALQLLNGVLRLERSSRWTSASIEGYQEAIALRPQLEARIPSLMVHVEGADEASVRVTIDGVRLRPPVLGVPRQLDPGRRKVEVEREGYEPYVTEVDLAEGAKSVVRAMPSAKAPSSAPSGSSGPAVVSPPPREEVPEAEHGRPLLVAGVVVGVAGLAGLGAAVITGSIAKSKESDLAPSCPGGVCPPDRGDELSSAEGFSTAANVLFAVGGVLGATGLSLIVVDLATHEPSAAPTARLRLGPAFVGIDGRF